MNYQPLHNYLHDQLGVLAIETEMQDIVEIVAKMIAEDMNRIRENREEPPEKILVSISDMIKQKAELPPEQNAEEFAAAIHLIVDDEQKNNEIKQNAQIKYTPPDFEENYPRHC